MPHSPSIRAALLLCGALSLSGCVAAAVGAGANTTALVGTPEQVADALLQYHALGVTTFLIRGFDPLGDAIEYGRSLIPLTREKVAERLELGTALAG